MQYEFVYFQWNFGIKLIFQYFQSYNYIIIGLFISYMNMIWKCKDILYKFFIISIFFLQLQYIIEQMKKERELCLTLYIFYGRLFWNTFIL